VHAVRRVGFGTWALAARVNLCAVRRASIPAVTSFPRPPKAARPERISGLSNAEGRHCSQPGVISPRSNAQLAICSGAKALGDNGTMSAPKPFVFVLMPFDRDFDDVYALGIKRACEQAGAYAERVDEQLFQESILNRIYNQIAKADVIVADLSGRNPNVFYETGYAHALAKPTVLLTRAVEDIPFDLKHYPHIIYGGRISDLIGELEKRLRFILTNPTTKRALLPRFASA